VYNSTYIHACMGVDICWAIYVCLYACMYIIYVCVRVCMQVYMNACMNVGLCMCARTYVYTMLLDFKCGALKNPIKVFLSGLIFTFRSNSVVFTVHLTLL